MRSGREVRIWNESFVAGADLSAKQFYVVKLDSAADGQVVLAGDGEGIGILQDHNKVGQEATVRLLGMSKGISGSALVNGDELASDADGKLVAAASGELVIGHSNTTTAAEDEFVEVLLTGIYEKN